MMSPLAIATMTTLLVFTGALAGQVLQRHLPQDHTLDLSRDGAKLVLGLVGTLCALVLSLLVASAKTSHDTHRDELVSIAAAAVEVDQLLKLYGPETESARAALRVGVQQTEALLFHHETTPGTPSTATQSVAPLPTLWATIMDLNPQTPRQHQLQTQLLPLGWQLRHTRLLMYEEGTRSITWQLLTMLIFWLVVLFLGFGLFGGRNRTATAALLVGSIAVGGALFLILEMDTPYSGMMQLSSEPLRSALRMIGG